MKHLFTGLKNLFLPAAFLAAGGFLSVAKGQDAMWDLLNYHLYNPFALLEGRFGLDIMPAGIHTFFNPLPDVPLYLMVKYINDWPRVIAFVQGMWFGLYAYILWRICRLVFPLEDKRPALLAFALGVTGVAAWSQIGVSTHEIFLAALGAGALWLLLKSAGQPSCRLSAWAGLLAGAAAGLKYTAAPAATALAAVALWQGVKYKKIKTGAAFLVAAGGGFLLCNGYFMWRLWKHFGNPFFPYFNALFKSPFFNPVNLSDGRFFPASLSEWLFYPFYWVGRFPRGASEIALTDPRLAIAFVSALLLALLLLRRKQNPPDANKMLPLLLLFCGVYYVLWLTQFSILRYAVLLEGVSGILCVAALRALLPQGKKALWAALALLLITVWGTHYPDWRHVPFGSRAVAFDALPALPPNALVLTDGAPMAFTAPFLRPAPAGYLHLMPLHPADYPPALRKAAARRNVLPPAYYGYRFDALIHARIAQHTGPVYLLAMPWKGMFASPYLTRYGLHGQEKDCVFFNANINLYSRRFALCPLHRRAA